jgi:hypothetical protein
MTSLCMKPIGGTALRATKVDACGIPLVGEGSCSIVTDGFVSVERTAQFADPDEFLVKNAAGQFCINERSSPLFQWYNLTITFCEVDPELINLMTNSPLVLNDRPATPDTVGWRTREGVNSTAFWALELWTRLAGQACVGGIQSYGYYALPFIKEGVVGDLTIENGPASFTVTQARSASAEGWGVGPYDVLNKLAAPTGPSPLLSPFIQGDHDQFMLTTLAPPAVPGTCGCVELEDPEA